MEVKCKLIIVLRLMKNQWGRGGGSRPVIYKSILTTTLWITCIHVHDINVPHHMASGVHAYCKS